MIKINTETDGNNCVLKLDGRLDVSSAPDVDKKFGEVSEWADLIVLDMSDLTYISSAGLRSLQKLCFNMKKRNRRVRLQNVRPEIMNVLEMTGFAPMLDIE